LPTNRRQPLRTAASGDESECDFGLAEFRGLHSDPDGACHRVSQPAASAKPLTAAITGLPRSSMRSRTSCPKRLGLLGLERGHVRELADVGAGDETPCRRLPLE